MNARERFLATLSGGRVDRPFLWESVFLDTAVERWRREGLPADADAYEYLGFDRAGCGGINCQFDPPLAEQVVADESSSELVEDEAGGILRRYKTPTESGGTIVRIRYPLRDRAGWEMLKTRMDTSSPGRRNTWQDFVEGARHEPSLTGHSDGFSGSCAPEDGLPMLFTVQGPTYWLIDWAGSTSAAMMLYDQSQLVEEIYEHLTGFITSQMEETFSLRTPDAVFLNEESCYKGGPFMSPEMYRRLVCPKLRRIADVCLDAGVSFVFIESGGDVTQLVPLWKEAGINGILPLDVTGGSDPLAIRHQHPDLALIGGIDRRVLTTDRDQIQREIQQRARPLFLAGRCIPSVDGHGAVREDVSFENVSFYAACLRREAERAVAGWVRGST